MKQPELTNYVYWSQRLVTELAEHQRVDLQRRARSFNLGFKGAQFTVGGGREALYRREVENRLIRKLRIDDDLTFNTPYRPAFVTASSHVELGEFVASASQRLTAYMYARIDDSAGQPVDVCLFGSMHNLTGWQREADRSLAGWASSSARWIVQLLESEGQENTWADDPNDYEPIAVEALKIVRDQGIWAHSDAHQDLPASRGYTIGYADPARWYAQIYVDVTLTEGRWFDMEDLGEPRRILIGAPLWARASLADIVPYTRALRVPAVELARKRDLQLAGATSSPEIEYVALEPDPAPARRNRRRRSK